MNGLRRLSDVYLEERLLILWYCPGDGHLPMAIFVGGNGGLTVADRYRGLQRLTEQHTVTVSKDNAIGSAIANTVRKKKSCISPRDENR